MPPRTKSDRIPVGKARIAALCRGNVGSRLRLLLVGPPDGRDMENPAIRISRSSPPGQKRRERRRRLRQKPLRHRPRGGEKAAAVSPGVAPVGQAASSSTVPRLNRPSGRPAAGSLAAAAPSPPSGATATQKGSALRQVRLNVHRRVRRIRLRRKRPRKRPCHLHLPWSGDGERDSRKSAEPSKETGKGKESFSLQVASYKEKAKREETAKNWGPSDSSRVSWPLTCRRKGDGTALSSVD